MARRSEVLDLAVEGKAKKKSRKGLIVGIAMLGVIPVIGSTLAASISLGTGAVEFGQGSRAVTACDDSVTVRPNASFNATPSPAPTDGTAGTFTLGSFTISAVDGAACAGKTFTVNAYKADGTIIDLNNSTGNSITQTGTIASGTTSYTATVTSTVASTDLAKITLESN